MATTATKALAGTAYVSVDGQVIARLVGELTYSVSKVKRTTLGGMDGIHGFKEEPTAPFISGSFRDAFDVSLASINAMTDVTVTCELKNGKVIIGKSMWTVDVQEVKTTEGAFDIRWESDTVTEA